MRIIKLLLIGTCLSAVGVSFANSKVGAQPAAKMAKQQPACNDGHGSGCHAKSVCYNDLSETRPSGRVYPTIQQRCKIHACFSISILHMKYMINCLLARIEFLIEIFPGILNRDFIQFPTTHSNFLRV